MKLTPGMQQYMGVKNQYKDCIVLFRMGDFYETFYDDAKVVARELEITLTARGKGETRAPLAGIPYHALEPYLAKLVKKGYKVAICEQVEDPKLAKGIVKREVVRIVSPGTVIESNILDAKSNNYIMSLFQSLDSFGIAFVDISTGEFLCAEVDEDKLTTEIARHNPKECIIPESLKVNTELVKSIKCFVNTATDSYFQYDNARNRLLEHFNLTSLDSFGMEGKKLCIIAAGALLSYLYETQKNALSYINRIKPYSTEDYMQLDYSTQRNLELVFNIRDSSARGTLISVLDKTITSMGSRLLKRWLLRPLLDIQKINKRLNSVEELSNNTLLREELKELLKNMADIERLISRINFASANPRDLIGLKNSLMLIPEIKKQLENVSSDMLKQIYNMDELKDVFELIDASIKDEPKTLIREGGVIKKGYDKELDKLHDITSGGKEFIASLEKKEKLATGINTLRVGFNNVFGYYIEVTKANIKYVPEHYIRKQTLVNAERYVTPELKEQESLILNAQERINAIEYDLYMNILDKISRYTIGLQDLSNKIANLDVLLSLSIIAVDNNYVKPDINDSHVLDIKDSRHAVVEKIEHSFVPNDCYLDESSKLHIITGPNMAGKSTFMRQIALIQLLAQIGSFVPASAASLGVVDRIFTRVGAFDDLSHGQSTFMVEMTETANILNNATSRSLVILDEIGRGTSTFDGISIAWAVAEHILTDIKARTLFATHYHQMNKLAEKHSDVKNFNIAVREDKDDIIFLRKIIEGGTNRSYGIQVAKLAGLPDSVIQNSKKIMSRLEMEDKIAERVHKEFPVKDKAKEDVVKKPEGVQKSLLDL